MPILLVVGVYLGGQALDAGFLSPNIVGSKIGLHPVWLIFSLFVFSYLFGFVGALVAVPLAAAIAVLMRFALTVYLKSPVYQGDMRRPTCCATPIVSIASACTMTRRSQPTAKQLVLELPHRQALGAEDFLVSRSNAAAVEHGRRLAVVGASRGRWSRAPRARARRHLAHVWQLRSGARSDRRRRISRTMRSAMLSKARRARGRGHRSRRSRTSRRCSTC